MIYSNMRSYDYFTFGTLDGYGQPQLSKEKQGTIRISIYLTSQAIQDNINYQNANYVGLTFEDVNDTYVIQYGDERLKVLYVNPVGRYKQVFMVKL